MIPAYLWNSLWVSLDSHYGVKFAFPCIQKQLQSIYIYFIETCPQLEGHFRGLIRRAALTLNIRGLDRPCVLLSSDPYLRLPQTMVPARSCYSFSSTANFTLNNGAVVKHERACDSLISLQKRLDSHAGQKPLSSASEVNWCFSCGSCVYNKVTKGVCRCYYNVNC